MNKRLVVLVLLALALSLPAGALAAAFPPSSLALKWDGLNNYTVLTVKLAGTVKMAPGPVKFYNLNGVSFSQTGWLYPVTGSGYLDSNGNFAFSLFGDVAPYGGYGFHQFQGTLSPSGTGTAYWRTSYNSWEPYNEYSITQVAPNTLSLP
jgi:hypothetical protein